MNVNKIRHDFPILQRKINHQPLVYLDNAATTQKPRQVIKAVAEFYQQHNANVTRSIHTLANEATHMYETARATVARFINAKPSEIIFVRNATEALNLVAFSWGLTHLQKGDVIITSILEHHSNLLPWRMVAEKTGAHLRYVDIDQFGQIVLKANKGKRQTSSPIVGPLETLLDHQVKLVALSAKSNMTGALQPIKPAVQMVRRANKKAVFVLDGSHSVPHLKTDVQHLGVDFLAFSGHKMLGPMGIGVLWGREQLLQSMPPFLRGGDMISEVTLSGQKWNTVPHKFEAGTPNVAGAIGLQAAINYLKKIGLDQIHQHEINLTQYALEKLKHSNINFELYGPSDPSQRAGVITFNLAGIHAHDVAQILDHQGIAVRSGQHCTGPLLERFGIPASVRASFYLYNTKEEIDKLVDGLKQVKSVFNS